MSEQNTIWRYEIVQLKDRAFGLFGLFLVQGPEDIHWTLITEMTGSIASPPCRPVEIFPAAKMAASLNLYSKSPATPPHPGPEPAPIRQKSLANLKKGHTPALRSNGSYGRMTIAQTEALVQAIARGDSTEQQAQISGYPKGSMHHLHRALAERIVKAKMMRAQAEQRPVVKVDQVRRDDQTRAVDNAARGALLPDFYPPVKIPTTIHDVIAYLKRLELPIKPGASDQDILRVGNSRRLAAGQQPFVIEDTVIPTTPHNEAAE